MKVLIVKDNGVVWSSHSLTKEDCRNEATWVGYGLEDVLGKTEPFDDLLQDIKTATKRETEDNF